MTDPNTEKHSVTLHSYAGRGDTDLNRLIFSYVPPSYLRPKHKAKIKLIKSLQQGKDGKTALCCLCGKLGDLEEMDVHHHNHIISDNRLENVDPAHGKCNDAENAIWKVKQKLAYAQRNISDQRQGEGEHQAPTQRQTEAQLIGLQYSNREGAKHEIMRQRYDKWIRDVVNGAFADRYQYNKHQLSEAAPYACGENGRAFGSSKTYLKFINEDIAGKILLEDLETGTATVSLNKDLLKKIQEATGI